MKTVFEKFKSFEEHWALISETSENQPVLKVVVWLLKRIHYIVTFGMGLITWLQHEPIGRFFISLFHLSKHHPK